MPRPVPSGIFLALQRRGNSPVHSYSSLIVEFILRLPGWHLIRKPRFLNTRFVVFCRWNQATNLFNIALQCLDRLSSEYQNRGSQVNISKQSKVNSRSGWRDCNFTCEGFNYSYRISGFHCVRIIATGTPDRCGRHATGVDQLSGCGAVLPRRQGSVFPWEPGV